MAKAFDLLDRWLERLAGQTDLDLVEHGAAMVPELLSVFTPADFELHLLDGSWLRAEEGEIAVELTAELVPRTGIASDSGVLQRRIDTAARRAYHHKLELPPEAHGMGRGRSLLRRSVDLYTQLGIEEVHLVAVDKGKYVWAAAGFQFADGEARDEVMHAVQGMTELLDLGFSDLDPDTCEPWDIAYLPPVADLTLREALDAIAPDLVEEFAESADTLDTPLERPGKLLLLADQLHMGGAAFLIFGRSKETSGSKCSSITLTDVATTTKKTTTSDGLKGAVKHLSSTSTSTARAIERHRARATATGRSVAHLVKR